MRENEAIWADIRSEGLKLLRSALQLESLYMFLTKSGLREAVPEELDLAASDALKQLLGEFRRMTRELDWELTGELVRLKDRCSEKAHEYARVRYGVAPGGHIRLKKMLPGLSDKLRVSEVAFVDDADYDLRVQGNPVRSDGTLLSETISMLLGPDGIKVQATSAARRKGLRERMEDS